MTKFQKVIRKINEIKGQVGWQWRKRDARRWFLRTKFGIEQQRELVVLGDPVRYGTVRLALDQVDVNLIPGALAECGVYKGVLSKFIHERLPNRTFYLFDTFAGFDERDSDSKGDLRFRDTSAEQVLNHIGETCNVIVRQGYFPETAHGLEAERFAFVMLDFDKYEPTLAALEFFYPRMSAGGFIFIHDYSSPESDWACSRAVDTFLADKPEKPLLIPDAWGTAVFRKT
ncbi:MAG: class I SAM-dependent methyltransferase [Planctomycetes bacterium]|nr:class I SAM-dependent methyltransferase [Planctomycetota bacterium]